MCASGISCTATNKTCESTVKSSIVLILLVWVIYFTARVYSTSMILTTTWRNIALIMCLCTPYNVEVVVYPSVFHETWERSITERHQPWQILRQLSLGWNQSTLQYDVLKMNTKLSPTSTRHKLISYSFNVLPFGQIYGHLYGINNALDWWIEGRLCEPSVLRRQRVCGDENKTTTELFL